jgi:hypothetical protein
MYYKKFERSEIYELIQRVRAECTIRGGGKKKSHTRDYYYYYY